VKDEEKNENRTQRHFFDEIADRVAAGEKVIIKAKGVSMRPFIRNGCDKIILEKLESEDLKKGNIVLVRLSDGRFVVTASRRSKKRVLFYVVTVTLLPLKFVDSKML
jgi:bisphosphoglycerate-dependent phosphoglycerate mutase